MKQRYEYIFLSEDDSKRSVEEIRKAYCFSKKQCFQEGKKMIVKFDDRGQWYPTLEDIKGSCPCYVSVAVDCNEFYIIIPWRI